MSLLFFNEQPTTKVEYLCKTDKRLVLQRVFVVSISTTTFLWLLLQKSRPFYEHEKMWLLNWSSILVQFCLKSWWNSTQNAKGGAEVEAANGEAAEDPAAEEEVEAEKSKEWEKIKKSNTKFNHHSLSRYPILRTRCKKQVVFLDSEQSPNSTSVWKLVCD